jgi:hypothetical protein
MKLRLTAHLTGILFLGVIVSPLFSSFHNQYSSHIDKAQVQHLESHIRKVKKHLLYLGILSPPLRIAFWTSRFNNHLFENQPPAYSPVVNVSCRAPPA